ncbi:MULTISPECIES: pantetheine-phosphate adenylyltransferase [unclassified Actinobaculum]|uniref:pantetheine-phosphate adenylyltransferase n=1 Tax=unclassified Actinobaculum TaxID=2609299 RepID=UPI000D52840B|nr:MULTISPECIES: pantetheine-phosphate adenylyltransferase [unclassified Actinobaculum]AWE42213.1 pantetheine-phosphate adenylyltransferase [Actinobaculum sp. 313]RTE50777.1 pantetheine-phosphate adenylyltransferase [Actinobaculum sp. 352]
MTIAVCPGSFDPITLGHMDVIRRARGLFDEVVVAVGANPAKRYLFSAEERCALASEALADIPGVRVELLPGLIAEYCRDIGAFAIIRGLRGAADYDEEQAMALMNRHLTGIETVFIMGDTNLGHVASSLVKDVASHGGDISGLVPKNVAEALVKRVRQNGEN